MPSPDKPSTHPTERRKRRIPLGCKIAAVILALIVLPLVGRHLYYRAKINAEYDAIRKAGFPVTLQELSDYYPVPQGQNAAEIYSAAFTKYVDGPQDLPVVGEGKLPPRGEPLPKEMQTAVSAYLTSNARALELLHKAATVVGCRYDFNLLAGYDAPMPHLARLRSAARLLQLEAVLRAAEGKPDEAVAATAASFAAAHSLRSEPLMISHLVQEATDNLSLSTLECVLSRTALNDQQLTDISKQIAAEDEPEAFLRGMVGDRCFGEDMFILRKWESAGVSLKGPVGIEAYDELFYRFSGVEAEDHLMYLKLMSEWVSIASGTIKDMRERPAALDKKIKQEPKSLFVARMLVAGLPSIYERQLLMVARLRAARAGIAVERFRVANGRLPDSLDELVPKWLDAVPSDPWDDQPIRYKKLAKGFVTYSIGPDLKDDSGKERDFSDHNPNATWDITFIVAR